MNEKKNNLEETSLQTLDNAGAITPFDPNFFAQDTVRTNLDITTMKGKVFAQKALSQADFSIEDLESSQTFIMESCLIHEVEIDDENKEETIKAKRVVLISPSGETAAFVSQGVYNSMRNIMGLFGIGPWNPPLVLKAKVIPTRKKRKTINLEVVFQDDPGFNTIDV